MRARELLAPPFNPPQLVHVFRDVLLLCMFKQTNFHRSSQRTNFNLQFSKCCPWLFRLMVQSIKNCNFFSSGNNVCKEYGCSHGCTEADGAVTCVCYEGLVLEPDHKTCIGM